MGEEQSTHSTSGEIGGRETKIIYSSRYRVSPLHCTGLCKSFDPCLVPDLGPRERRSRLRTVRCKDTGGSRDVLLSDRVSVRVSSVSYL